MRPTLTIILMALLLQACGPLRQAQKVQSQVPILGSVGLYQTTLFEKGFQKMGEPEFGRPISVAIEPTSFSGNMRSKYDKYREHIGKAPLAKAMDSTQMEDLKYYQLSISDVVSLVGELNKESNSNLKKYLQEDTGLVLLSSMSFVAVAELSMKLDTTEKLYLTTDRTGALVLLIGGANSGYPIKQSALEIFDFETSAFCWQKDKRGKLDIAHILMDGGKCPGTTEANPEKLNKTPDYLKL
ncbi:hypothetical protein [Allomuricauda sp. F6463D]|uniref:hypothetical protein n=1 Tax=Allomuricauda sp. F6463D TaxID=2926409 RepID=UPI001FF2AFF5|nr:hypothetical protein [Muricauda sp. F6463D]MCK0160131.1 hypothetical protein [Muricauda sp. F6463D]